MRYFLLLPGIFIFLNPLHAQSGGYVVTKKNDTIYCQVKLNSVFTPQYKSPADGKFHTIKPKNFIGYRLTGYPVANVVKEIGSNHKPVFVVVLAHGKINLYQETGYIQDAENNWIIYTNWYASGRRDSLIQIANDDGFLLRHRKQVFYNMLADQPQLAAAFDSEKHLYDKKFDIQKIIWYVQQYNQAK